MNEIKILIENNNVKNYSIFNSISDFLDGLGYNIDKRERIYKVENQEVKFEHLITIKK